MSETAVAEELVARLEAVPLDTFTVEKEVQYWVTRVAETCIAGHGNELRVLLEGRDFARGLVRIVDTRLLGGSFWPDIAIISRDARAPIVAVEVKLLKTADGPGGILNAIGQALAYRYGKSSLEGGRPYPAAVAFVVDQRQTGIIDTTTGDVDAQFRDALRSAGVHVVVRRK